MHRNIGISRVAFVIWLVILLSVFSPALVRLAEFAADSNLYSHVLLVPFIVAYLIWLKRKDLTVEFVGRNALATAAGRNPGVPFLVIGILFAVGHRAAAGRGALVQPEDALALWILSFLCLGVSGGFIFLGKQVMAKVAFPVAFLFFMVPFPTNFTNGLEGFLQHTSADAASMLFSLSGATVLRDGLVFRLPGISIEVAKECSGIHSTLMLLITSLLAGHLFLRSPWKKATLALAVIPLGIARNGIRIFTISWLCVHVDPSMIDSPIHHRGGPLFFILSLVLFLAVLFVLRRSEHSKTIPTSPMAGLPAKVPLT
jgi:exosortase C (VPDSG-CTERM-specific)